MDDVGVDHVDLLKIDIEGAEFDLLATAPLDRVGEMGAEIHYDLGTATRHRYAPCWRTSS